MALIAVALVGLATTVPLRNQRIQAQRERETELLFIGQQFRQAIASYVAATPGKVPQYPMSLDDLLTDRRFPQPRRHLRRLWIDPFTGEGDWTLIREQGAIVGVASRSGREPLKRAGFAEADSGFMQAKSLSDWQFIVRIDPATWAPAPGNAPSPGEDQGVVVSPPPGPALPGRGSPERAACMQALQSELGNCMSLDGDDELRCREQAQAQLLACLKR